MTRTLQKPASSQGNRSNYKPQRGVAAPKGSGRKLPGISLPIGKIAYGILLVAVALASIGLALGLVFFVVPLVVRGILSLLGFGGLALPPALAIWYMRGQQLGTAQTLRTHLHHLVGAAVCFIGLLGLAAAIRPGGLTFWGVSWAEVSYGGLLGQVILGTPTVAAISRTALLVLAGVALAYPSTLPLLGRTAWYSARLVWRLGLHRHTWHGIRWIAVMSVQLVRRRTTRSRTNNVVIEDDPSLYDGTEGPRYRHTDDFDDERYKDGENALEEAVAAPIQSTLLPIVPPASSEEDNDLLPANVSDWDLPGLDLLDRPPEPEAIDQTQRAKQLEEALASYGVEGKVVQIHVGPAVTQFGVEPGWDHKYREVRERDSDGRFKVDKNGNPLMRQEEISRTRVKVERITGLSNNLALALAAPSVRMEAPVPGKQVVGIEVPNITPGLVPLHSVIESSAFQRLRARSKLALALGKAVAGDVVAADLAKMPHLLIAGATGSGKSVCINAIVTSVMMQATPDEVRFLMIDPKRVELVPYNSIPHLLAPVIVEPDRVVGTLNWVIKEMDNRYRSFAAIGVRNIEGYNRSPKAAEQMPYWVVIIDELADLMMVAPFEVERALCRLAQLARATGIHLVVATQRPSVDVITGLIKANFPTRISFAVTSYVDSRTILDGSGAEKLLGRGDMLYMATDAAKPRRVQGTYVSDAEVERLVEFWTNERYNHLRPRQFEQEMEEAAQSAPGKQDIDDDEDLLERARELADTVDNLSTSLLQRRLRIGYPRAARIMETLKEEGYGSTPFDDLP